jgi:hypothetical protein
VVVGRNNRGGGSAGSSGLKLTECGPIPPLSIDGCIDDSSSSTVEIVVIAGVVLAAILVDAVAMDVPVPVDVRVDVDVDNIVAPPNSDCDCDSDPAIITVD